jgi:hypothetical protein
MKRREWRQIYRLPTAELARNALWAYAQKTRAMVAGISTKPSPQIKLQALRLYKLCATRKQASEVVQSRSRSKPVVANEAL